MSSIDHGNNPLWVSYLLQCVLQAVMENPLIKRDFMKIAEAGEVLQRYSCEYVSTAAIVKDIRKARDQREWKNVWCKPDNWEQCQTNH